MIRPKARKFKCAECANVWVAAPLSDALVTQDVEAMTRCPRCGSRELRRRKLSWIDKIFAR